MASPGSQAKDKQANKPGSTGKQTESGSGSKAMAEIGKQVGGALASSVGPVAAAGAGATTGVSEGTTSAGRTKTRPDGGSATSYLYEPGSVPNFPEADSLTVFEKIFAPLAPGVGAALAAAEGGKLLDDDDSTNIGDGKTILGGDPGPQVGWSKDRGKGASSFNPNDARGTATDDREIPGTSYGSGTQALTGDSEETVGAGTDMLFSDVTLRDRRKPKNYGAGTEMVLGA